MRQEEDARHERADPERDEQAGQRQMDLAAVGQPGVEHGRHHQGGRDREAEVDVQGPAQLVVALDVVEDFRLDDLDDRLEAKQRRSEERRVGKECRL